MKGDLKIRGSHGFTIIEVMIFLTVSAAMLLSAIYLVDGKQNSSEFTQAINLIQSQIQQTANDIINGYYPSSNNFVCTATAGAPTGTINITSGAQIQGSNEGCIFIGKVLQFGIKSGSNQNYYSYTIVGAECANGVSCISTIQPNLSNNLAAALPTVLRASNGSVDATVTKPLQFGLNVSSMQAIGNGPNTPIGAVAFLQTISNSSGNGGGSEAVNLYAISHTTINNMTEPIAVPVINTEANWYQPGSVEICFSSATTNASGLITIGGANRQISVTLKIYSNTTCS